MLRDWRVYFNRSADAPQVWSVDYGSHASEVNVRGVKLFQCSTESFFNPDAEYPEPKAWFLVRNAHMFIGSDGYANFQQ